MAAAASEKSMQWLFFSPSGRIGRQPFLLGWLFWLTILSCAFARILANETDPGALTLWVILTVVTGIASTASVFLLTVKRLHDIGQPGMLALFLFLPVISPVMVLALCFWPGDAGPNDFGHRANEPNGDIF